MISDVFRESSGHRGEGEVCGMAWVPSGVQMDVHQVTACKDPQSGESNRGSSVTTATPRPAAASACATAPLLASMSTRAVCCVRIAAASSAWRPLDVVGRKRSGSRR